MGCTASREAERGPGPGPGRDRDLGKSPSQGHAQNRVWEAETDQRIERSPESSTYLGWRQPAVAAKPLAVPAAELSGEGAEALQAERAGLRAKVVKYLGSPEVVSGVLSPEIIGALMEADADWRPFVRGCLQRVRDVNALGGPRMQVVWWGSMRALQRIPMWPTDRGHVLDAEGLLERWTEEMDERGKVGGRGFCVSAFSHRWERPSLDAKVAHPDTPEHKKAAALAVYGEHGTCPIFEPNHKFDYYYWVDLAGVNQLDAREKQLGVCKLPAFISVSTEIIMYNSSTVDYEPRAWTRVERALGFTFTASPLFVYMDDNYPNEQLDLDEIVAGNPRCFTKDAETGALKLIMRDPCGDGAATTDPRDKELLDELTSLVRRAVPLNPQRIASGMQDLEFGRASILLDTEHYSMDCVKQVTHRVRRVRSVLSSSAFSEAKAPISSESLSEVVAGKAPTDGCPFGVARQEQGRIKMIL